jgi:hypothetical protein
MKELTEITISFGASIISAGQDVLRPLPVVVAGVTKKVNKYNYQCGPSVTIAFLSAHKDVKPQRGGRWSVLEIAAPSEQARSMLNVRSSTFKYKAS